MNDGDEIHYSICAFCCIVRINFIASFTGFSVGCCINRKVICYQLEHSVETLASYFPNSSW